MSGSIKTWDNSCEKNRRTKTIMWEAAAVSITYNFTFLMHT